MTDPMQKMADLLLELERELRVLQLWSEEIPSVEQMQSTVPFAADRLALEHWLQWIFIPTIKKIIESDGTLPGECGVHPYAEESLKQADYSAHTLLDIIRRIDEHITRA